MARTRRLIRHAKHPIPGHEFVDDLFDIGSGYVLDFADWTMSTFFTEQLNVDIDDPAYRERGTSKVKRQRCYLMTRQDAVELAVMQHCQMEYLLEPRDVLGAPCTAETFAALRRPEEREHGEYRTRRLVLEAWGCTATAVAPVRFEETQVPLTMQP